jgi:hypothetical protein
MNLKSWKAEHAVGELPSIDLPAAELRMATERESISGSENAFVFVEDVA